MQKISEISTLFDANQDARNSTPYYIIYRGLRDGENGKRSFVSMSSGRLAMQGRSSCRLVREQKTTLYTLSLNISAHLHRQRNLLTSRVSEDMQMMCRLVQMSFKVIYTR